MNIAVGYPSLSFDGELTFVGVLRKYIVEYDESNNPCGISKNWNSNTLSTYIRHYEKRIIPRIAELCGTEKPLYSFTEADFEKILDAIGKTYPYSAKTLQHYRYLIWIVYAAGVKRDLYPDQIFWGGVLDFDTDNPEEEEKQKIMLSRIPKSFTLEEEYELARWISSLVAEKITGEELGLLVMYFTALRENEIGGLNFQNIYLLREGTKEIPVLDMLRSTQIGSSKRKAGGKTSNAPRIVPITWWLYQLIEKRKAFLKGLIEKGELILPDEKTIEDLPVACVGYSYLRGTNTNNLSKAGHRLFERMGIAKQRIIALNAVKRDAEFIEESLIEESPTTYLFRRAACTTFSLFFSEEELEYLMGHDIESPYMIRNFFRDFGTLYDIWGKMEQNPIKVFINHHQSKECQGDTQKSNRSSKENVVEIEFAGSNGSEVYDLQIQAKEPCQPVSLELVRDGGGEFDVEIHVTTPHVDYPRTVDIGAELAEIYHRYLDKIEDLPPKVKKEPK